MTHEGRWVACGAGGRGAASRQCVHPCCHPRLPRAPAPRQAVSTANLTAPLLNASTVWTIFAPNDLVRAWPPLADWQSRLWHRMRAQSAAPRAPCCAQRITASSFCTGGTASLNPFPSPPPPPPPPAPFCPPSPRAMGHGPPGRCEAGRFAQHHARRAAVQRLIADAHPVIPRRTRRRRHQRRPHRRPGAARMRAPLCRAAGSWHCSMLVPCACVRPLAPAPPPFQRGALRPRLARGAHVSGGAHRHLVCRAHARRCCRRSCPTGT